METQKCQGLNIESLNARMCSTSELQPRPPNKYINAYFTCTEYEVLLWLLDGQPLMAGVCLVEADG